MFIVTAKLPRRALAIGTAAVALFCCCLMVLNLTSEKNQAVSAMADISPKGIRTNEDRIHYLAAYGWETTGEPVSTQELLIPTEMDESYTEYLTLQNEQGFELEKYAGKRVKRYTYELTNYPTGEVGVQANLLIYRNRVVGGEVLSPRLDGFLHGLLKP